MRYEVEAGTDVASLLLFDPVALSPHFDECIHQISFELLRQLAAEGRACWIEMDSDGGYLLHAYVNESVPGTLQPYLKEPVTVENFVAPTGNIYFTGTEYAFGEDGGKLNKYPSMGGMFCVSPGRYRLTIWRTEYPDGLQEELLHHQVGPYGYWVHQSFGCLIAAALVGVCGLWTYLWRPWGEGPLYLAVASVVLILLPVIMSRSRLYREAQARWRAIEREFPALVAHLEWLGPYESPQISEPREKGERDADAYGSGAGEGEWRQNVLRAWLGIVLFFALGAAIGLPCAMFLQEATGWRGTWVEAVLLGAVVGAFGAWVVFAVAYRVVSYWRRWMKW